ncbi:MAG: Pr6Pr family membrane protein [Pseudolysinimonas sp.]
MTYRRALGTIHLVVAAILLFTVVFQTFDLHFGGSLIPSHYFLFFTIDTTLLAVITLGLTGLSMRRNATDGAFFTAASLAIVPLGMVTGIVYNLTLRGLPSEVYLGMDWENEIVHVAGPLFLVLDWFVLRMFDRGRPRLGWSALGIALVFPLVWIGVTMLRGYLVDGWFPYPFLQPSAGPAVVGGYIGAISVFVILITTVGILASRYRATTVLVGRRRATPET